MNDETTLNLMIFWVGMLAGALLYHLILGS